MKNGFSLFLHDMWYILVIVGIFVLGCVISFFLEYLFSDKDIDRKLADDWKKARFEHECLKCVTEIDALIGQLDLLRAFYRDSEMKFATRVVRRMVDGSSILNYELQIHPFLLGTRARVSHFLENFREDYNPDNRTSIYRSIINVADEGELEAFKNLLNHENDEIFSKIASYKSSEL